MEMTETTLNLYKTFTEAGVKPDTAYDAERSVQSFFQQSFNRFEKHILERVMTREDGLQIKAELAELRADTKAEIAGARTQTAEVKSELGLKIEEMRSELGLKIERLGSEMNKAFVVQLRWLVGSVIFSMIGSIAGLGGILVAALKLLH